MRVKRLLIAVLALLPFAVAWHAASNFMIAKAIAPPKASMKSIILTMLHPRYQMAAPHRSLLATIRFSLVPTVNACGPSCDGYTAKPRCPETCPPGYCYCPGCQTKGCTPYYCTYVGELRYCIGSIVNSGPCETCEVDYNSACTNICNTPPCIK
jgi:hypothetical protein